MRGAQILRTATGRTRVAQHPQGARRIRSAPRSALSLTAAQYVKILAQQVKNVSIYVSLRGRSAAVAILKSKVWHPVAKHGSTKQEGIPITKNMRFAASFRATIFRYGMTNRIVKDCRVGRKNCALLAMTESVDLIENTERKIQSSDSVKRFLFVD